MSRHHQQGGEPSQRMLRVGELIRHALADLLQRGSVADPALDGRVVTVPDVRMSPDLKLATAYVMPLGGRDAGAVVEALERNRKFLRGAIANRIAMKFAPDIRFRLDGSFERGARIDAILASPAVRRDLDPPDEGSAPDDEA